MKLEQLLESPTFLNKEMPVYVSNSTVHFYSDATIEREFDIIGEKILLVQACGLF